MKALVLAGGLSHERDVSLRSGRRVVDALRSVGVDCDQRDADAGLLDALPAYDAVLVALHGGIGEDGSVREVLELAEVPYVGSTPSACRAAWDKPAAKALARAAGVRTPHAVVLTHATFQELGAEDLLQRVVGHLGLPLMVKPARGGSALGATAVHDAADLPTAMVTCFGYGEAALVEQFVVGTEVAVAVVEDAGGPRALPPVEVRPLSGVYDYAARYTAGSTEYFAPARLGAAQTEAVTGAAVAVHRALGLRDLSRIDLVVAEGVPHLLEANSAPGMTETSLVPMAVAAAGLQLGTVLRDLLQRAVDRG